MHFLQQTILTDNPLLLQFELRLRNTYKTNGGHMFDLNVTFENKDTTHRVIVGKEYYEAVGLEPEEVLAMTFAFLLRNKVPRQTEGELFFSTLCCTVLHSQPDIAVSRCVSLGPLCARFSARRILTTVT